MASFTDQISSFNPYIAQLPVEAMVQVGMQKQAQYDAGVQKIQAYVDEIGGLPVATDADRKYLQSSLNQLGSNLKYVAAGDFSNQQLVNSVGGMATKIVKDPVIKNAVSSANWYKEQNEKMQKAIDEGKSNPANIDLFNSEVQKWLTSGKAGYKFNSSYTPFFDVDKFAKEQFDAIKPGNYTFDQMYETDANGNPKRDAKGQFIASPVLVRLKKEGRLPQEVEGAINQIMSDPRVGQQLQITGRYNYKNYTPTAMVDMLYDQRDSRLGTYLDKLAELNLDKKLGKDVQKDIDALTTNVNTITSNYDQLAQQAIDSPDALKGYLYKQSVMDNYKSIYGSVRTSQEAHTNPLWESNFKMMQEANEQSRFVQTLSWEKTKFGLGQQFTAQQNELNRKNALMIAGMKGRKGLGGSGVPGFGELEGGGGVTLDENSSAMDVTAEFERLKAVKGQQFLNSSYSFVWDNMFAGIGNNDARIQAMVNKGVPREKAIETMLSNSAKLNKEPLESYVSRWGLKATEKVNANLGKATPSLVDSYNKFKKSLKEYNTVVNQGAEIDKQVANIYGTDVAAKIKTANIPDVDVTYNGQKYKVTKEDLYDAAVYVAGHKSALGFLNNEAQREAAKSAEERLRTRGKAFILDTALDQYGYLAGDGGQLITGAVRGAKQLGKGIAGIFGSEAYLRDANGRPLPISANQGGSTGFGKGLQQALAIVDNEKTVGALNKRAELLKSNMLFKPNLKMDLITGDAETDRGTYSKLKTIAGNYVANNKNLAPIDEVKGFAKGINQKESDVIEAKIVKGADGEPIVQVVSYNTDGEMSGRMTIREDEARNLGIDVGTLYESDDVADVRRSLAQNPNRRTSRLDPDDRLTYIQGDAYFEKNDFPRMKGTRPGQDMKANIKYQNGLYYGVVYARDEFGREGVQETEGQPDLNTVVKTLKLMGPEFIPSITNR